MKRPLPANSYWYNYVLDFAAVKQGGNLVSTITLDAATDFLVDLMLFTANYTAGQAFTSTTALSGFTTTLENDAKLYRVGQPNLAQTTNFPLSKTRLEIKVNDLNWQSAPMRSDLITSEPGFLLPLIDPIIIRGKSTIMVTVYNDIPAAVSVGGLTAGAMTLDAELIFTGMKVPLGFTLHEDHRPMAHEDFVRGGHGRMLASPGHGGGRR